MFTVHLYVTHAAYWLILSDMRHIFSSRNEGT